MYVKLLLESVYILMAVFFGLWCCISWWCWWSPAIHGGI